MTVTHMYANAINLKPIRDNGYGDADFDIKVQRLKYNVVTHDNIIDAN